MDLANFNKLYECSNKTAFINENTKTLIVVFTKHVESLDDILKEKNVLVSTNTRYTKFTSVVNNTNCEYLVINDYTKQDLVKFTLQSQKMIQETPDYYKNITLPNALSTDKQWIYQILDGVAENERILYEDEIFVLLKDIKWANNNINDIHLLALLKRRDILSIRDLDDTNIDLVKHIDKFSRKIMLELYGFENNNIRSYFHYYPSYWHLHVHFDTYGQLTTSDSVNFCKLLFDVVQNIEIDPKYYKKITFNIPNNYF